MITVVKTGLLMLALRHKTGNWRQPHALPIKIDNHGGGKDSGDDQRIKPVLC
ncbi:hypothetical protein KCP74_21290 [Salmonella enterica subsp. enterica]|nr:hypothetical protein KCP74_21290 [Salmonella enterica subsp. enterica]